MISDVLYIWHANSQRIVPSFPPNLGPSGPKTSWKQQFLRELEHTYGSYMFPAFFIRPRLVSPPPENGQRTWRIVVDVGVVEKRRRKNGEDLECGEQIDWPWVDRWAKWWHNPAWKYIQDMCSKYTKSDFEIGLVQFFKDDRTDSYIVFIYWFYLYLNLMIPTCIWCIRLPWTLHLQKVPVEHGFCLKQNFPEQDACYNIVRHFRPLDKTF